MRIKQVQLCISFFFAFFSVQAQNAFIFPSTKIQEIKDSLILVSLNDYIWGQKLQNGNVILKIFGNAGSLKDSLLYQEKLGAIEYGKVLKFSKLLSLNSKNEGYPSGVQIKRVLFIGDTLLQTAFQNFLFVRNNSGFLTAEICSKKTMAGNQISFQKPLYDFATDSLALRLQFSSTDQLADVKVSFSISLSQNIILRKYLRINTINTGDEFELNIGRLPESFKFGGKAMATVEVYGISKQLLFSIDEMPVLIKGEEDKSKSASNETDDPFGLRVYSTEELEMIFNISDYFATTQERKLIRNLVSTKDKVTFLNNFWSKRTTNDLKYLPNFFELAGRIETCKSMRLGGLGGSFWKSDRSRVLLVYGIPSQIEREPFGRNSYSSETWNYNNIENGVEFVFVDLNKDGNYKLVHSNKTGELYNPSYRNLGEKNSDFNE